MLLIHQNIKQRLDYFRKNAQIPNLLFHGPTGSGKTTIIRNFIADIYQQNAELQRQCVKYVNCVHINDMQFIRDNLKIFVQQQIASTLVPFKIVVLENANELSIEAQSALRRCIEIYMNNTRFFIETSSKRGIIKPILSRFCEIYVSMPIDKRTKRPINLFKQCIMEKSERAQIAKHVLTKQNHVQKRLKKYIDDQNQTQQHNSNINVFELAEEFYDAGISTADIIGAIENNPKYQDAVFKFCTISTNLGRCEKLAVATLINLINEQNEKNKTK